MIKEIKIVLPEDQLELEKLKSRFLSHVEKTNNCWIWKGFRNHTGYGKFQLSSRISILSHRASYTLFKGEIPKGLSIDHLCFNHACVNPEHLEAVTYTENTLRGFGPTAINSKKTHCIHGHEFTPENTYIRTNINGRDCKICRDNRFLKFKIKIRVKRNVL